MSETTNSTNTIDDARAEVRAERAGQVADLVKVSRRGRLVRGRFSPTTSPAVVRATWEATMAVEWATFLAPSGKGLSVLDRLPARLHRFAEGN